eukprot:CAMPEP_0185597604 /NCGR_PEP_ID=MMETSP0434-20130131/81468_1 /TAXON_ID=626734 ORGANISM="Favella taraikaensis, Strain Fe Narragansett Bay" /NCGR_SAMPLE_ID=MMETSP0434 /ASSEMBLY_ACC=CAM_ASM_000379 /LENGTH=49 /DNA_ID=CAMNT_0028226363 /DNA_START=698 /DNA_END=850 /DNA_ORIENTATION=-
MKQAGRKLKKVMTSSMSRNENVYGGLNALDESPTPGAWDTSLREEEFQL